jgi:glutamyl/glutaminyl-tRNA synthetase
MFLTWVYVKAKACILNLLNPHTNKRLKTRIAPTPSGYLHVGNALSFAITWALARQQNGIILLRIDDLDNIRFRPEYLQDIFDTLHFLGLDWDEGPGDAEDFSENYSQHKRLHLYNSLLDVLISKNLLYACTCSRKQLAPVLSEALHCTNCLQEQLPLDEPQASWRICLPEDARITFVDISFGTCQVDLTQTMPDFVVRTKNGLPAYQVASLCDDLHYGINTIVRGQDLLPSTAAQLFMAKHAGLTFETRFMHHPLALETTGVKLSKSHDALSICEMRKAGASAADVWKMIARLLGWQPAGITNANNFLDVFRSDRLPAQLNKAPQLISGIIS